jgi:diamine N-acetyltransferase
MNTLSNGFVRLRALEPEDLEFLYACENDLEVWRVSNTHAPISKYMLANYIKSSDRDIWESRQLRLVIELPDKQVVGSLEIFDFDPFHLRAGVGVIIFANEDRRKGIASQALRLLMNYAHNELGIYQLYANVSETNEASIALFRKLGFLQTGCKTDWLRLPGKGWESELIFQCKLS